MMRYETKFEPGLFKMPVFHRLSGPSANRSLKDLQRSLKDL